MSSPDTDEQHALRQRTDQSGVLRKKTLAATGTNNAGVGDAGLKIGMATGNTERPVVKQPGDQKATRADIHSKITAYNNIKPKDTIAHPDFLNAEHDPQKTEGLIDASTACINVIDQLIGNASDDVKSQTKETRKKLQDTIKNYKSNQYTGHDKLTYLNLNPETVGGKRKRSKKIGTKKKQYKRK